MDFKAKMSTRVVLAVGLIACLVIAFTAIAMKYHPVDRAFREKVVGKSKYEVIRDIGIPIFTTSHSFTYSGEPALVEYWVYDNRRTVDENGDIGMVFKNGSAVNTGISK